MVWYMYSVLYAPTGIRLPRVCIKAIRICTQRELELNGILP